ncbi:hypothetical protein [Yersinia ruckeri]|uniref:hypothetical protein n=1 Tax=Yersinia ruckeri TaxID=29486 RepID=UPI0022377AE1|nr:hypothetical protein [Yersinia ruckeri]MCW6598624.1 hypothetical protein [Yersinia ruckeri]
MAKITIEIPDDLHPDSVKLLEGVIPDVAAKMVKAQVKRGLTNEWLHEDWEFECRRQLSQHVNKGDPLDVIIYGMFCQGRGWRCDFPSPKTIIIPPSNKTARDRVIERFIRDKDQEVNSLRFHNIDGTIQHFLREPDIANVMEGEYIQETDLEFLAQFQRLLIASESKLQPQNHYVTHHKRIINFMKHLEKGMILSEYAYLNETKVGI